MLPNLEITSGLDHRRLSVADLLLKTGSMSGFADALNLIGQFCNLTLPSSRKSAANANQGLVYNLIWEMSLRSIYGTHIFIVFSEYQEMMSKNAKMSRERVL